MVSEISNLTSTIQKTGLARASRYIATFSGPAALLPISNAYASGVQGGNVATLSVMCQSISLPGRAFNTTNHIMYGTTVKLPFGVSYNDLVVTFNCSDNMHERIYFDMWHSWVANNNSNYFHYYDKYVGSVQIDKYDNQDNLVYTLTAEEAYPYVIEEQALAYDNDVPLKLSVHFAYRKWTLDKNLETGLGAISDY